MSMKIPDSPNVIGTQPVLRQVDSVNPQFERPNFKIDVSQPAQAIKDTGKAYADYVEYNTNIWMNAACTQWTHDMIAEEQALKDTHTEFRANDLYAKLEKKATALLDDMTGEPKEDGRIRIANPELQKRFRDWASKQMPAYQTRMMNYTASELDKANKRDLERGIKDNNDFILGSTMEGAKEQFDVAFQNYVRAAQISAPGMSEEYQLGEAARMMDEAVYTKMKVLGDNNIIEALTWYYNVPEVKKSMSSKSEASFFADIEKNYISQGGAQVAEELATGGSGAKAGGFLDQNILRAAFPTKNDAEIAEIYTKVYDKGREINDARIKAQQGMREQQLSSVQGKAITTDLVDPMAVAATYREYHNVDPVAADDWLDSVQKYLSNAALEQEYNDIFPMGTPFEKEDIQAALVDVLGKEPTEQLLSRSVGPKAEIDIHMVDVANRYDKMIQENAAWLNSPVYTEYTAKAAAGEYHGEDVPELRGMPLELKNNLSQIVYYNDRYNEVLRMNPHLNTDIQSRVKDYKKKSSTYIGNIKREIVKSFDRYRQSGNSYPLQGSIEYDTIINTAVKNAESPTKARTEQYLNSESIDYLQKQKINSYLNPVEAREALEDVDALPLNLKVAKKIKADITAEALADAIISSTPRAKRHRIEPYREAIIQTIEQTGNADVWYNYIDGIGQ